MPPESRSPGVISFVVSCRHKFDSTKGGGGGVERDKIVVDKFGSPTSYQMFPSILRMRCAKCAAEMTRH